MSKLALFPRTERPIPAEVRGRIALQMLHVQALDSNEAGRNQVSYVLPAHATGASEGPRSSLTLSMVKLRISKPVRLINEQRALL